MPKMKTRSKNPEPTLTPSKCLNDQAHDPLKLMILPKETSPAARICTLSHPRTSTPSRYYVCPEKGIYEFTRVAAPKSARQSWLLAQQHRKVEPLPSAGSLAQCPGQPTAPSKPTDHGEQSICPPIADGYIIKTPELLVATPIDLLFLILPALHAKSLAKSNSSKGLFLSADDILETLEETSKHFNEVTTHNGIRQSMESRMSAVCDTVDAGDETMFRLNKEKLLAELVMKARAMVEVGFPASMEDRFVSRALARPVAALKREESSPSVSAKPSAIELPVVESVTHGVDSQASTTTSLSIDTEASVATELTILGEEGQVEGLDECRNLLRLRVALTYMMSSYIPQALTAVLTAMLASAESPVDFEPLDKELALIAKMRSEALASRSISDFSRKRGMHDDDEAAETRAEKKSKKEEEEKKKRAGGTRGIRDLQKVNTTGMKKMSDFFGKASATKKNS